MKKLKLTYIRIPKGTIGCIPQSHYDLHTDEAKPKNVACILTDKEGAKVIKTMVRIFNDEIEYQEDTLKLFKKLGIKIIKED